MAKTVNAALKVKAWTVEAKDIKMCNGGTSRPTPDLQAYITANNSNRLLLTQLLPLTEAR